MFLNVMEIIFVYFSITTVAMKIGLLIKYKPYWGCIVVNKAAIEASLPHLGISFLKSILNFKIKKKKKLSPF